MRKVAIIGCGKIFPRHLEAVQQVEGYRLVSVCDSDAKTLLSVSSSLNVPGYLDYREMLCSHAVDLVVIATPNYQHYEQALHSMSKGCDVLIEKPATLNFEQLLSLEKEALRTGSRAYGVLQVRLNPAISVVKELIGMSVMGAIRSVSMVQRWQRPYSYFSGWRGDPKTGGGLLHECGIHYLDILCYLFGKPSVVAAKSYNVKHVNTQVEDTIYCILDFGSHGGAVEVSVACEPCNLECSLSIVAERGYLKIGGKALDEIVEIKMIDDKLQDSVVSKLKKGERIRRPNKYGNYSGSCPNHPELYREMHKFQLAQTRDVIGLIDEIYSKEESAMVVHKSSLPGGRS